MCQTRASTLSAKAGPPTRRRCLTPSSTLRDPTRRNTARAITRRSLAPAHDKLQQSRQSGGDSRAHRGDHSLVRSLAFLSPVVRMTCTLHQPCHTRHASCKPPLSVCSVRRRTALASRPSRDLRAGTDRHNFLALHTYPSSAMFAPLAQRHVPTLRRLVCTSDSCITGFFRDGSKCEIW